MLNDCIVQIEAASPWYRSNKKLVSVTIKIVNDNNSLNVLNYNRLKLFSSKNVFFLKSVLLCIHKMQLLSKHHNHKN